MTSKSMSLQVGRRVLRRWAVAALVPLFAGSLAGCGDLLDVELPGAVSQTELDNPILAVTLARSAQADFECMVPSFIWSYAIWTQELWDAGTGGNVRAWQLRQDQVDGASDCQERIFRDGGQTSIYGQIQTARFQGRNARELIGGFSDADVPDKTQLLATSAMYEAFATLYMGEVYCQARLLHTEPLVGPTAILEAAVTNFTDALALAQTDDVRNAVRVGLARTLARLGRIAEAKTHAEVVPAGFEFLSTHDASPNRRLNWIHMQVVVHQMASTPGFRDATHPGYRNLMVQGVPDPRVQTVECTTCSPMDGITTIWEQLKYPAVDTDIAIATWEEAQLIVAEAELAAGNAALATDAINAVRASWSLPLYGGGTTAEVFTQLMEERRRELWLEGQRQGDHTQFGLPYIQGFDHKSRAITGNTCQLLTNSELA